MTRPVFGKTRFRSIYASENNPHRDGIYVETIHRPRGGMNPGKHYRLTDGRGRFWRVKPGSVIEIDEDGNEVSEDYS